MLTRSTRKVIVTDSGWLESEMDNNLARHTSSPLSVIASQPIDEMAIVIQRKRTWLWRAVENEGEVLVFLAQRRRNVKAARKFLKLMKT